MSMDEHPKRITTVLIVVNVVILGLAGFWLCRQSTRAPATAAQTPVPHPEVIIPRWPSQCDQSRSISLPSGTYASLAISADGGFWVAHDTQVERFSSKGEVLESIEVGSAVTTLAAQTPTRVFAASDSALYRLEKIAPETPDATGAPKWQVKLLWQGSPRSHFTSLAVAENLLMAADAGERKVLALDPESGQVRWESTGESKFVIPSPYFSLSVTPEGTLWIVNPGLHRLESCSLKDGRFVAAWQPPAGTFSGCCNPAVMVALSGDRFATLEKGLFRLRLFAPSGKMLEELAGPTELSSPFKYALAADAQETLFLLDDHRDEILCFPTVQKATSIPPGKSP